jgi:hypothetical protein
VSVSDRLDDIRLRLETISEELGDLAIDALRRAIDEGATARPPVEKTLNQARRAIEKAARLLEGAATSAD